MKVQYFLIYPFAPEHPLIYKQGIVCARAWHTEIAWRIKTAHARHAVQPHNLMEEPKLSLEQSELVHAVPPNMSDHNFA